MSLLGGLLVPAHCLGMVVLRTLTVFIHETEVALTAGMSLLGGLPVPARRAGALEADARPGKMQRLPLMRTRWGTRRVRRRAHPPWTSASRRRPAAARLPCPGTRPRAAVVDVKVCREETRPAVQRRAEASRVRRRCLHGVFARAKLTAGQVGEPRGSAALVDQNQARGWRPD